MTDALGASRHDAFTATYRDGLWTVRFTRADRRNALDEPFALALAAWFRESSLEAPGVPVLICADGPVFCAGADVSFLKGVVDRVERERRFAERARTLTPALVEVVDAIAASDAITVATIQGAASGGGWSLALACDFRIAASDARFWFPESEYGRPLSETSIAVLAAKVGQARATEIVLLSRRYDASELLPMGLVNEVVASDQLDARGRRLATQLAAMTPEALAESKRRIRRRFA